MYYQLIQSKESIFFRVDGDRGLKAGLGHVYRTLKIYRFLKKVFKNQYNFIFIMKNYKLGREIIFKETGEKILDYDKVFNNKIINQNDIVIIDTLGAEKKFLNLLHKKKLNKIVSFDELNLNNFKRGLIINGIYFAKKKLKNTSKKIKIYQGPEYLVLNKEFEKKKEKVNYNNRRLNVLITSGGADKKNFLFKILKKINFSKQKKITFYIVAGKGVNKNNPIFSLKRFKNIVILKNIKNMKKILDKVQISIVSGGTVMFESICCGKITFACQTYFHQNFAIRFFEKKNIILNLGTINRLKTIEIGNFFKDFSKTYKNYNNFFRKRTKTIDGLGLQRVNKILYRYIDNDK